MPSRGTPHILWVAGVLAVWVFEKINQLLAVAVTTIFWISSYSFVCYGTAFVRVDAPMLLIMAVAALCGIKNSSVWFIKLYM
ncbi:MAG: hypothetical protein CL799_02430 [Chromatiales bacterium]|jgi:hypothetical protein|nr:hypothetical protein [Chromatiales bacterium]